MFNPVPEVKKGFYLVCLLIAWMVYLFFEPFSALITAAFLIATLVVSLKEFK
jgi:hypothetical protein